MKKHPRRDDVIQLPNFASKTDLFQHLYTKQTKKPVFISSAVVVSRKPIQEVVSDYERNSAFGVQIAKTGKELCKLRISLKSQRADIIYKKIDVYIIEHNNPKFNLLLTFTDPKHWGEVVIRFIKSLFPVVIQPFLRQEEMKRLLYDVEQNNGVKVLIKTIASKRWFESGGKKGVVSRRDWFTQRVPIGVEDAFAEAEDESKWFKQLSFEMQKGEVQKADSGSTIGKLSKDGQVSFSSEFEIFWRSFVQPIAKIAEDRLRKFMNKSREFTPEHKASPLVIEYSQDLFKNFEQRTAFIKTIKAMPNISYSVLHANPHVHMSILDYYDGSAVDLWILSSRRLTLVPQIKTSEASLSRIVRYISEEFFEGELIAQ